MVLVDNFQDTFQEAAHGNVAAYAARQQGFRGKIYAEKIGSDFPTGPSQSNQSYALLGSKPLDPATARNTVQDYTRHSQRELLEAVTGDLDKIRGRGLKDSAVNVSYGTHPEQIAEQLYRQVRTAPRQDPGAAGVGALGNLAASMGGGRSQYQFAQNVLNGYGIDQKKFYDRDPKVSSPERAKLQQSLLNAAEAGGKAPDVQAAKTAYGEAVKKLEANNNSVVVSVGNQGEILDNLASDANGRRIKPGPDTGHNVLVNSDVTTVGSTRWFDSGKERIAKYTSKNPETDIYASGSVGNGQDQNRMNVLGTSFAAPRVAGVMATLHGTHPGMSSSAVENLMKNRLTHETEGQKVLDYSSAEEYMRRGTF